MTGTTTAPATAGSRLGSLWALAGLTLLWGINWPLAKFALRELSPLEFRTWTPWMGVAIVAGWLAWRRAPLAVPRHEWPTIVALSVPNMLAWQLFSIYGIDALQGGRAALLAYTMPAWALVLGRGLFGLRAGPRLVAALALSLAAVGLLTWNEWERLRGWPVGVVWMQCAAASWALGTLLVSRSQTRLDMGRLCLWMLVVGALGFTVVHAVAQEWRWPTMTRSGWAALVWAGVMNVGVGQVLWLHLARHLDPMASALSVMATPVVGLSASALLLGEALTPLDALAAALIVATIALARWPQRR